MEAGAKIEAGCPWDSTMAHADDHNDFDKPVDGYPSNCRDANSGRAEGDRVEYGRPGCKLCGSVAKEADDLDLWSYDVVCPVVRSQVRGKYLSREKCLSEMTFWLRQFGCPGHVPDDPDGPDRPFGGGG
jgi:hypothetical protein